MKKDIWIVMILVSLLAALTVHQMEVPHGKSVMTFLADGTPEYIMLQGPDTFPLYFVRHGDRWQLTLDGTMHYPIDTVRFDAFLAELTRNHVVSDTGIRNHHIHNTGNRARYSIESGTFNGPKKCLYFGEPGRSEQFRYISSGDIVYRTDNEIHRFLDSRTARWVLLRPFDTLFAKTGLQHAVLSQDGTTSPVRVQDALGSLQRALEGLYCIDITNIPATPEQKLVLELGNLSTVTISFSRISAEHVLMTETVHNAAWIIPGDMLNLILGFFTVSDSV